MNHETRLAKYNPDAVPTFFQGQTVRIGRKANDDRKRKGRELFSGKVISVNSHHVTVKNKDGQKECFLYTDFITGDIELIKKSGA